MKDILNMMKKVSSLKKEMAYIEDTLKKMKVDYNHQDLLDISISGKFDILDIKINEELLQRDKQEVEKILKDALNKAKKVANKEVKEKTKALTHGLGGAKNMLDLF